MANDDDDDDDDNVFLVKAPTRTKYETTSVPRSEEKDRNKILKDCQATIFR